MVGIPFSAGGNRCGHVPSTPRRFVPPPEHKPRPKILIRLRERIRKYYDQPSRLPSLNLANGSTRQQRSERREACLLVLETLLHYLDLATLTVGIPEDGVRVAGLTMKTIAAHAGLSLNRAERAIHDLKRAGILSVHPIVLPGADGQFEGHAAIRAVSPKLFDVFGLGDWLRNERERASAKRRKARLLADRADRARRDLALPPRRRPSPPPTGEGRVYSRTQAVLRLMEQNPGADLADLFDQVRRSHPLPASPNPA